MMEIEANNHPRERLHGSNLKGNAKGDIYIYICAHMNYFLKIGPRTCLGNIWNVNTDMTGIISLTNAHKHIFT